MIAGESSYLSILANYIYLSHPHVVVIYAPESYPIPGMVRHFMKKMN